MESSYTESAFSEFDSDNHNQPIPQIQLPVQQQIDTVDREDNYSNPFSVAASDDRSLANNQRTFEEILAAELAKGNVFSLIRSASLRSRFSPKTNKKNLQKTLKNHQKTLKPLKTLENPKKP